MIRVKIKGSMTHAETSSTTQANFPRKHHAEQLRRQIHHVRSDQKPEAESVFGRGLVSSPISRPPQELGFTTLTLSSAYFQARPEFPYRTSVIIDMLVAEKINQYLVNSAFLTRPLLSDREKQAELLQALFQK